MAAPGDQVFIAEDVDPGHILTGRYRGYLERNREPAEEFKDLDLRLERRRHSGYEALDNTEDDPPVGWDVEVSAVLWEGVDPQPYYRALHAHPRAPKVRAPVEDSCDPSAIAGAFVAEASTAAQAEAIGEEVARNAFNACLREAPASDERRSWSFGWGVEPRRGS